MEKLFHLTSWYSSCKERTLMLTSYIKSTSRDLISSSDIIEITDEYGEQLACQCFKVSSEESVKKGIRYALADISTYMDDNEIIPEILLFDQFPDTFWQCIQLILQLDKPCGDLVNYLFKVGELKYNGEELIPDVRELLTSSEQLKNIREWYQRNATYYKDSMVLYPVNYILIPPNK